MLFRSATARGKNLYLHVMEQPVGPLALTGLSPAAIRSARVLATGAEADILTSGWAVQNYPQTAFLSLAAQANETLPLPDETDTVLHLTISET